MRVVAVAPTGYHGLLVMSPNKPFDVETYQLNLFARFFMTRGKEIWDDGCLAKSECPWLVEE